VSRIALALALGSAIALVSCAPSHAAGGPVGWRKTGATTWAHGTGAAEQRYIRTTAPFNGSLKDLASQETINVILRYPGAHFVSSVPLAKCPAQAGLATFRSHTVLIKVGFSVQGGQALTALYEGPANAAASDAVAAMNATLCALPV